MSQAARAHLLSTIYTMRAVEVARLRQENDRRIMRVKAQNRFTLPAGDMKRRLANAKAPDPRGMSFDADEMAGENKRAQFNGVSRALQPLDMQRAMEMLARVLLTLAHIPEMGRFRCSGVTLSQAGPDPDGDRFSQPHH